MQQHTPIAFAVGVEVGTSAFTVSIGGDGGISTIRRFDTDTAVETVIAQTRTAWEEITEGPAPVAFAVPSWWEASRRRELEAAAERAGLGAVAVVPAPEAAACYYRQSLASGRGNALVVFDLGAGSCDVSVVRWTGERPDVTHSAHLATVGGNEFDQLLLAYLSGRYSDTDPAFWAEVDDPVDVDSAALRARLLDEIRIARERISSRPRAGIPLPGGDHDLLLTRAELESCIGALVAQCADVTAEAIASAGADTVDLLLIGGTSRTPVIATVLGDRTGLEPVLPERPETALAEGARLLALARAAKPESDPDSHRRTGRRLGVLAAVLLPVVAGTVFFGFGLGADDDAAVSTSESSAAPTGAPSDTASSGDDGGSGGGEAAPSAVAESPAPDEDPNGGPERPPSPSATEAAGREQPEEERQERQSAGTIPNVTAMSVQEAMRALSDAGFTETALRGQRQSLLGPWYDDCEVFEQHPAAGEQHAYGDPITLTYSYRGTDASACET